MKNFKQYFLPIILGVVLIATGFLLWRQSSKPGSGGQTSNEKLVEKVTVNLTPEQQKKIEQDIADLKNRIKIRNTGPEPDLAMVYIKLGIDYEVLGELGKAREAYLDASKERAGLFIPWSNLGSLYQQMGSDKLAKEALEKALALAPAESINWEKWLEFNRLRLKLDDASLRDLYAQAFKATNDNLNLHRLFARYLEEVKDEMAALDQWQFILEVDPFDKGAEAEATRLRNKLIK